MTKLLIVLVAGTGIALAGAPVASASEDAFIKAIDSLDYYAIDCPGCVEDALDVGYRVCEAFDAAGDTAAIREVLRSYNGPGQSNPEYHATLFAQYAADELCPQHDGKIGPL
ncbi:DUF732 domain-containing protein [Mycolicibacterium sp. 120270]|uniref:DUF732 domain-containing protein n=1 Tax=Mycolicibacterium sp. 120270 TaxID=3090600 RepID=UPI00299EA6D0|nr:DUF732 domain-containing protein [Mycolicibacterium sp. 120270]MDX1884858.1 DUF732 domain-containing protein [Mycolicibacterium sp. 120270]